MCDVGDWVDDNWDTIGLALGATGLALCVFATGGFCLLASGVALVGNAFSQAYDSSDKSFDFGRVNWAGVAVDAGLMVAGLGAGRLLSTTGWKGAVTFDLRQSAFLADDFEFVVNANAWVSFTSSWASSFFGVGSREFWR